MTFDPFLNAERQLGNGWWIVIIFVVLASILGRINVCWLMELCLGGLTGCVLMVIPALILGIFGWVSFQWNPISYSALTSSLVLFAGGAVTEELLFRGFAYQRLILRLGQWSAQLITAAFFLLTHLTIRAGTTGGIKIMVGVNIYLASILFGLAFIRTRSLVILLGLHYVEAANSESTNPPSWIFA